MLISRTQFNSSETKDSLKCVCESVGEGEGLIQNYVLKRGFVQIPQPTFQVVLSTNGVASFAALVYQDPSEVASGGYQAGFDAGDSMRGINLLGAESINWSPQGVNIFRIDGV